MIVAWTGHRPDLFRDPAAARKAVVSTARELVEQQHAARFLVGGQRGVDTWAARTAFDLGVPFSVFLPLDAAEFSHDWQPDDRAELDQILALASDVRVVSPGGAHAVAEQAFSERNRLLVAGADLLVAVWAGLASGGTAQTIAIARSVARPLREVMLDPTPTAAWASGHGI